MQALLQFTVLPLGFLLTQKHPRLMNGLAALPGLTVRVPADGGAVDRRGYWCKRRELLVTVVVTWKVLVFMSLSVALGKCGNYQSV